MTLKPGSSALGSRPGSSAPASRPGFFEPIDNGRLDHFQTGNAGAVRKRSFASASLRKEIMTSGKIEDLLDIKAPHYKEDLKRFFLEKSPDTNLISALLRFCQACEPKNQEALDSMWQIWNSFRKDFIAGYDSKPLSRGVRGLLRRDPPKKRIEIDSLTEWMKNYQRGPH